MKIGPIMEPFYLLKICIHRIRFFSEIIDTTKQFD
jgi:hypothetical protein